MEKKLARYHSKTPFAATSFQQPITRQVPYDMSVVHESRFVARMKLAGISSQLLRF